MVQHYFIVYLALYLHCVLPCIDAAHFDINGPPPPELARTHGYRCDVHHVTTQDGYILQLHRLPGGRLTALNCSQPPVIVVHGLFASSADFFLAGPSQALSYLLADQGYDVWLPNCRGNTYSKEHVSLSTEDNSYWNFSWHEIGIYDIPAVIDYVLETTGHRDVIYVGHSMGTTAFFVMCSMKEEYNAKVQYMVALAPVAYLTYMTSVSKLLKPFGDEINAEVNRVSHGELFSRNSSLVALLVSLCKPGHNKHLCAYFISLIFGFDPLGTNVELAQQGFAYDPAGGSAKSSLHYGQLIATNHFRQFDYGLEGGNVAVYGSPTPPSYDLSHITVPLGFFCSENDAFSNPKDVEQLVDNLKDVKVYRENISNFNHMDFYIAKNVKELLYDKLIALLKTNQRLSDITL